MWLLKYPVYNLAVTYTHTHPVQLQMLLSLRHRNQTELYKLSASRKTYWNYNVSFHLWIHFNFQNEMIVHQKYFLIINMLHYYINIYRGFKNNCFVSIETKHGICFLPDASGFSDWDSRCETLWWTRVRILVNSSSAENFLSCSHSSDIYHDPLFTLRNAKKPVKRYNENDNSIQVALSELLHIRLWPTQIGIIHKSKSMSESRFKPYADHGESIHTNLNIPG